MPRYTAQNTAILSKSERKKRMIKVMFVCHGSIWTYARSKRFYALFRMVKSRFTIILPFLDPDLHNKKNQQHSIGECCWFFFFRSCCESWRVLFETAKYGTPSGPWLCSFHPTESAKCKVFINNTWKYCRYYIASDCICQWFVEQFWSFRIDSFQKCNCNIIYILYHTLEPLSWYIQYNRIMRFRQ